MKGVRHIRSITTALTEIEFPVNKGVLVFLFQNINSSSRRWYVKALASEGEWVSLLPPWPEWSRDGSGTLGEGDRGRKWNQSTPRSSWSLHSSEGNHPTRACPPYLEGKTPQAMPTARIPERERRSLAGRSWWPFSPGETQGRWSGQSFLDITPARVSCPNHTFHSPSSFTASPPTLPDRAQGQDKAALQIRIFKKISLKT